MKVYKVSCNPDLSENPNLKFQDLSLNKSCHQNANHYFDALDGFRFNGNLVTHWQPPVLKSDYPKRKVPDFWNIGVGTGAFAVNLQMYRRLEGFFGSQVQPLQLAEPHKDLVICNVLSGEECIDDALSKWRVFSTPEGGTRRVLQQPFFVAEKIPRSGLFKLVKRHFDITTDLTILTLEQTGNPEEEFKPYVEANKFTGLKFKLVWSEERGIVSG